MHQRSCASLVCMHRLQLTFLPPAYIPPPQVRCFEDDDVIHVAGKVDPLDDTDVINFELALADITQIERRMERLKKGRVKGTEEAKRNEVEAVALGRIMEALEQGLPARSVALNEEEDEMGEWQRKRCIHIHIYTYITLYIYKYI